MNLLMKFCTTLQSSYKVDAGGPFPIDGHAAYYQKIPVVLQQLQLVTYELDDQMVKLVFN